MISAAAQSSASGSLAALAASRSARATAAAQTTPPVQTRVATQQPAADIASGSVQPSLIWARPLRVLSTSSTGYQGDLIQSNGGFVAGFAEVDGRGRVVSLTPTAPLIDPAVRAARQRAERLAAEDEGRRAALAQGATTKEADAEAKRAADKPVASSGAQAEAAIKTQAAYQATTTSNDAAGQTAQRVSVTA